MPDFHALTDAFAELERRADASPSIGAEPTMRTAGGRPRPQLMLVAAAAVAVLAVATGGTLLTRGGGSGSPAAAPPTAASYTTTARTRNAFQIPKTPADLASRFRAVLGNTATFTVTDTGAAQPGVPSASGAPSSVAAPTPITSSASGAPGTPSASGAPGTPSASGAPGTPSASGAPGAPGGSNGAAIVGTLSASGVKGGFDLQIFRGSAGDKASCDDADRSKCTVRRLADGSSLAVGSEPLQGSPHGVTYQVTLIRRDGVEFLMHLSNERDPKGESTVLAALPPLTSAQMTAIVTSNRW